MGSEDFIVRMGSGGRDAGSGYVEKSEGHGSLFSKAIAIHGESMGEGVVMCAWEGGDGFGDEGQPNWTREPRSMHKKYLHLFWSINMNRLALHSRKTTC
jgi:hypothetical protein